MQLSRKLRQAALLSILVAPGALLMMGTAAVKAAEIPALSSAVVDTAGVLTASQRRTIDAALRQFKRAHGPQMQVLLVPTLDGDPIEDFSIRVVESWKLGDAERDDGVLLLAAIKDRKWRIEVGGGLEGELPDVVAARIGREQLAPRFRAGDYGGGVTATLGALAKRLGGDLGFPEARPPRGAGRSGRSTGRVIIFFIIVALSLIMRMSGRGGGGGMMTGLLIGSALSGGRRSGYSSGGFSGGGWGGGGGGFSGGGASGGW